MERRKLGNTDMTVSVLGFGGWEIGRKRVPASVVASLLNGALDAGLNVIDTGECYKNSEELIGLTVSERRREYFIFTKCGHLLGWNYPDWRPSSLLESIERSLKRLKTDYVDLLQLHSCSEADLRKGDVIDALNRARERGYTRYIGYSGDGVAALYAVKCRAFDTLQISINIADQEALDLALSEARKENLGVIAKRPIANVAWINGNFPPADSHGRPYWERLQALKFEFLKGNLKQSATAPLRFALQRLQADFLTGSLKESIAMALRFTVTVPGVHTAIVGTTKPGRFEENAAIVEAGPLPQELFNKIRGRWHEVASSDWIGET